MSTQRQPTAGCRGSQRGAKPRPPGLPTGARAPAGGCQLPQSQVPEEARAMQGQEAPRVQSAQTQPRPRCRRQPPGRHRGGPKPVPAGKLGAAKATLRRKVPSAQRTVPLHTATAASAAWPQPRPRSRRQAPSGRRPISCRCSGQPYAPQVAVATWRQHQASSASQSILSLETHIYTAAICSNTVMVVQGRDNVHLNPDGLDPRDIAKWCVDALFARDLRVEARLRGLLVSGHHGMCSALCIHHCPVHGDGPLLHAPISLGVGHACLRGSGLGHACCDWRRREL
mmetsp:Transcript_77839/g.241913  ORF Transcript_77839/g.241913 Transcript_77839/m.241913 type:complete len:284 (+) Transcript_77839:911-1762(+)